MGTEYPIPPERWEPKEESEGEPIGLLGHAGPYFPYDPDDPRAPAKEKRGPGFVRPDEYVKGGVVKTYKRKRKR